MDVPWYFIMTTVMTRNNDDYREIFLWFNLRNVTLHISFVLLKRYCSYFFDPLYSKGCQIWVQSILPPTSLMNLYDATIINAFHFFFQIPQCPRSTLVFRAFLLFLLVCNIFFTSLLSSFLAMYSVQFF